MRLSELELAQRSIYRIYTYDLCYAGRPLLVISRSISIIPSISADNQCNICVT